MSIVTIGAIGARGNAGTPQEPSADHPNEPVGFTQITDRAFNARTGEDGWTVSDSNNRFSIGADATAPRSPSNIGVGLVPQGYGGGGTPFRTDKAGWSARNVYVQFWHKHSENWQGHSSGVNKIIYLTAGGSGNAGDPIFFNARHSGGVLEFEVMHQNPDISPSQKRYEWDSGDNEVSPSRADATLTRGQWHHIEVVIRANTAGEADGQIHAWVDGTKILQFTSCEFMSPDDSGGTFDNIRWEPIWGGVGDSATDDMWTYIDHIYVSGAN